jgi:hypothetical protein
LVEKLEEALERSPQRLQPSKALVEELDVSTHVKRLVATLQGKSDAL